MTQRELVHFIVLFTCCECRNVQDEIRYNVLTLCHECRKMINPVKIKIQSQNQVKYLVVLHVVLVMFITLLMAWLNLYFFFDG